MMIWYDEENNIQLRGLLTRNNYISITKHRKNQRQRQQLTSPHFPIRILLLSYFLHFFVFLLLFSHSLSGWKWHKNSTALFSLCSVHFWNKLLTFIVSSSQHIERLSVNIIKVLYLPLEGVRDEKIIHNELDFFSKHTLFFREMQLSCW